MTDDAEARAVKASFAVNQAVVALKAAIRDAERGGYIVRMSITSDDESGGWVSNPNITAVVWRAIPLGGQG